MMQKSRLTRFHQTALHMVCGAACTRSVIFFCPVADRGRAAGFQHGIPGQFVHDLKQIVRAIPVFDPDRMLSIAHGMAAPPG
jgi:hypothetical protein